jgi:anaerobic dimethyl sulfoxide reductase subunit B (iron-sulfur subunit)
MKKQYAFYFDSSKCSGCKTCQIACKDKNNLDVGILWRRVYEVSDGGWTNNDGVWSNNIKTYNMSIACNHCENPICIAGCPTSAIHKNKNGIVTIDEKKCIGCRYCEWSCPYGAPQYDELKGIMGKCDLCIDYVEDGKNPSCVDACPMRVLDFGELSEIEKKYGGVKEVYPLPNSVFTDPSIIINPHKDAIENNNKNAKIINEEEI